jgi:hypothetical protein
MLVHSGHCSSIGKQIDQMDPSVAPPRLITRAFGATALIRSGRLTGIQSPLSNTARSEGSRTPTDSASSTASCMIAGTEFHTVTPCSPTSSSHAAGLVCAGAGRTSVAPATTVPNRSYTDRSKHSEEIPKTTSSEPMPNRRLMSTMVLSGPRWSSIAPLGVPVEPDV